MTGTTTKRNRFPRFSLRTLIVLVTLVCVYFGCREITKRYGEPSVACRLGAPFVRKDDEIPPFQDMTSPLPFIVEATDLRRVPNTRRNFVWFFGWMYETPISSTEDSYDWELSPQN